MNEVIREWVAKAEGDFATATREMASRDNPNFDAVCFHAQQCIEKYLKALLIDRGVIPPKIHDLAVLSDLVSPVCPDWHWPVEELRLLTRAAVVFRYPGESAEREEAAAAMDICTRMRDRLRQLLAVKY
ncbi:MAG: HEPN domain-containing protein [Sedimentisphaerales bacterium]|nr:HEPN domain-containing protein [Sedimentisphaerales bacterium]